MLRTVWILLCTLIGINLYAQSYNNEWIDYNKTYYKFKVGRTGLYRIDQAVLSNANLANTPVEQFQLWRNGKQVPLFTSVATGALPTGGYIEFWGEQNDGKPDKALYRDTTYQLSDKLSLQTDTAAFFLTVNTKTTNNLRYITDLNDVANNTLAPEPYFIHNYRINCRDKVNRGYSESVGTSLYSSSYDLAEFLSSSDVNLASPYSVSIGNLYNYTGTNAPLATLNAGLAGNAGYNTRNIVLSLNNNALITQNVYGYNAAIYTNNNVNLSSLTGNDNFTVSITGTTNQYDRAVASFIELQYPRQFNFGNSSAFPFALPASLKGNYLEITNFNGTINPPVLYDATNLKRYIAETSKAGIFRFALPPSATARNLVLVSEDATNIITINSLTQRNFLRVIDAANQGNYLIISNPLLYGNGNPVEQYRAYRSSTIGGGYNAKIYDIDELVDQFAFGIKKHPLAIKNFVRYATNNFNKQVANTPKYVFLIGKAITYDEYRMNESSGNVELLNLVPTFGWPASDAYLASSTSTNPLVTIPIGRLAAISPSEVTIYLNKIKEYDQQNILNIQTVGSKSWRKQVVHVAGVSANDPILGQLIEGYLNGYARIIEDTLFGGKVTGFTKSTSGGPSTLTNQLLGDLFQSGINLLTYFGHSAATTLDYNLGDPSVYNNQGKYPVFLVNGCDAGNFFDYDIGRFSQLSSLAEIYVFAQQKGSIAFIADSHFGLTDQLDSYSTPFYQSVAYKHYNDALGLHLQYAQQANSGAYGYYFARLQSEQMILHGDPAIKLYGDSLPDFAVEAPDVAVSPAIVSVADNQFTLKSYFHNIGKARGDSVNVLITRTYPNGTTGILFNNKIKSVRYIDSIILNVPIIGSRDKGINSITVTIDNNNQYPEMSESNNTITKSFDIFEDELNPVYPYKYAIINKPTTQLIASTANPLSGSKQYIMELDTTELFNSSFKITKTVTSTGGVIAFDPAITLMDSTVYYWRVAPIASNGNNVWNYSSFVYLNGTSTGYNQSHLYQHLKSATQTISLDSFSRQWNFGLDTAFMQITHSIFGTSGSAEPSDYQITINGVRTTAGACLGHSIIFNLFDPLTNKPWYNQATPSTNQNNAIGGFMGSAATCGSSGSNTNFEFSYGDTAGSGRPFDTTARRMIRDFLNWIPDGTLVTARLILDQPYAATPFADRWKKDAAIYGTGNTLYDLLKSSAVGFTDIDSFNAPRTFVLAFKKNNPNFKTQWKFSRGLYDKVLMNVLLPTKDTLGFITSPAFGPAMAWHTLKWRGKSLESVAGDVPTVTIKGVTASGTETDLMIVPITQQDVDISSISATLYPYLKLQMRNADSINYTPYQLRYWRLLADLVPEGALAPNIQYSFRDTLSQGEPLNVAIAFKNISDVNFRDSITVNMQLTDNSNVTQSIPISKLKKLQVGDTAIIKTTIDTKALSGNNTLYVNANPNYTQPEQYLGNNFFYKNFFVTTDNKNPLMDVTFDGIHILNGDIVSSKPSIRIKLKDESKYLALDDTSLVKLKLIFPDANKSIHQYAYGTDTLTFTPANLATGENSALVTLSPYLPLDGTYELQVTAKDKNNNKTGTVQFSVLFTVNNKPQLSNVFNYPNPFTTSTAFVFTLTGNELPSIFRIQILTVTGKIVREINKNELGPLHIGRNITEFKWDGTDQYGQKLGNGVYLYRIIANLHGNALDKYDTKNSDGSSINTDQYFKGGYGKMYLMR